MGRAPRRVAGQRPSPGTAEDRNTPASVLSWSRDMQRPSPGTAEDRNEEMHGEQLIAVISQRPSPGTAEDRNDHSLAERVLRYGAAAVPRDGRGSQLASVRLPGRPAGSSGRPPGRPRIATASS